MGNFSKRKLGYILTIFIGALIFGQCRRSDHLDLTSHFNRYRVLEQKAQIIFHAGRTDLSLLDGWYRPEADRDDQGALASSDGAQLQFFLQRKETCPIRLVCRVFSNWRVEILANGKPAATLELSPQNSVYHFSVPEEMALAGINRLQFFFSPVRSSLAVDSRIVFIKLYLLAVDKNQASGSRLQVGKKKVELTGPLASTFFLRTHSRNRLTFSHRSKGQPAAGHFLKIRIEDFQGQSLERDIGLSTDEWQEESIDLARFPNHLLKVSFSHLVPAQVSTEIREPRLENLTVKRKRKRIYVFGLDGASWNVMQPLLEAGQLPNLKKLIDSGVSASLETISPMYSPVIWSSIMTGKVKEKHGIHDFLALEGPDVDLLADSTFRLKTRTLWDILSGQGLVAGISGPWVSWPVLPLNGYILSDRMYYRVFSQTVYPFELKIDQETNLPLSEGKENEVLEKLTNLMQTKRDILRPSLKKNIENEIMYLNQDDFKVKSSLYFNRLFDPDFFFLYLRGPDVTGHFFWKFHQPDRSVAADEIAWLGDPLSQVYIYQDRIIGDFLAEADQNDLVVVVSDHGMIGHATYKPLVFFNDLKTLWKVAGLEREISRTFFESGEIDLTLRPGTSKARVKERLTRFFLGNRCEPLFDISDAANANTLKVRFKDLPGLDISQKLFFSGRELGFLKNFVFVKEVSGTHFHSGVMIMKGPGILQGRKLRNCSVLDMTPTILYLLGFPVGQDMDGRVIREALEPDFLRGYGSKTIPSYDGEQEVKPGRKKPYMDSATKNEILERLRTLGYID